jgi:CAAX protease family protein
MSSTPTSEDPPRPADADVPPWPPWTIPAALLMGFGAWIFATVIIAIAASAAGASVSHPTPAVSILLDVVFDLSFVGGALYFTVLKGSPSAEFGFRRVRTRRAVVAVVVAAVGYYAVTAGYASLFKLHGSDRLPSELGVSRSTAALIAAAVFVCVIAPIAEEVFFRGFLFGALRRWIRIGPGEFGTWVAAAITGVLFGLVHSGSASPQYLVPLGFLGFVLCVLRWRTGSLYPCIALHCINNSVALGVNQLSWNAGAILGLIVGALVVVAGLTGPIGLRNPSLV